MDIFMPAEGPKRLKLQAAYNKAMFAISKLARFLCTVITPCVAVLQSVVPFFRAAKVTRLTVKAAMHLYTESLLA